jgi:hypothetical protein
MPAASNSGVADAPTDRVGQLLDAVTYAVALTVAFSVASAVLAVAAGWAAAPGVKYGLFVFGWLAFGYGTFLLLPSKPWKDDDTDPFEAAVGGGRDATRFQDAVQRLPPARFRPVPSDDRLSTGARIFLGSLVMLGVSIVLEVAFGIGP